MFAIDFGCGCFDKVEFTDDFTEEEYNDLCLLVTDWCKNRHVLNEKEMEASQRGYNDLDTEENHQFVQDTVSQIIITETGYYVLLRNTDELIAYTALKQFLQLPDFDKGLLCNISHFATSVTQIENAIKVASNVCTDKMNVF